MLLQVTPAHPRCRSRRRWSAAPALQIEAWMLLGGPKRRGCFYLHAPAPRSSSRFGWSQPGRASSTFFTIVCVVLCLALISACAAAIFFEEKCGEDPKSNDAGTCTGESHT